MKPFWHPSTNPVGHPSDSGFRYEIFLKKINPLLEEALHLKDQMQGGRVYFQDFSNQSHVLRCSLLGLLNHHVRTHSLTDHPLWRTVMEHSQRLREFQTAEFPLPASLQIAFPQGTSLQDIGEINHARRAINAVYFVVGFNLQMNEAIFDSYGWDQESRHKVLTEVISIVQAPSLSFVNHKPKDRELALTRAFYFYQILCASSTDAAEKRHLLAFGKIFFNRHSQFRPVLTTLLRKIANSLSSSD